MSAEAKLAIATAALSDIWKRLPACSDEAEAINDRDRSRDKGEWRHQFRRVQQIARKALDEIEA